MASLNQMQAALHTSLLKEMLGEPLVEKFTED